MNRCKSLPNEDCNEMHGSNVRRRQQSAKAGRIKPSKRSASWSMKYKGMEIDLGVVALDGQGWRL
jgi:hypothetical protein